MPLEIEEPEENVTVKGNKDNLIIDEPEEKVKKKKGFFSKKSEYSESDLFVDDGKQHEALNTDFLDTILKSAELKIEGKTKETQDHMVELGGRKKLNLNDPECQRSLAKLMACQFVRNHLNKKGKKLGAKQVTDFVDERALEHATDDVLASEEFKDFLKSMTQEDLEKLTPKTAKVDGKSNLIYPREAVNNAYNKFLHVVNEKKLAENEAKTERMMKERSEAKEKANNAKKAKEKEDAKKKEEKTPKEKEALAK